MVLQTDKGSDARKATIIRQTPKKSSQSNAYVERAHQSIEAMVRTMKEVIEDKAHTRLSATDSITSWMIRHAAFLQTRFSVGKDGKTPFKRRHHKKSTRANFYHSDQLLMRKSETRKLNAANSIHDSFEAFGSEEPQRAMGTLSEQHWVFTHGSVRAKNDQEIWNSGLIKSMKGTPWAPRGERTAKRKSGCLRSGMDR